MKKVWKKEFKKKWDRKEPLYNIKYSAGKNEKQEIPGDIAREGLN